jgi:tRNA threonylcarbamoyladenosine biosynthesis protein TsaB
MKILAFDTSTEYCSVAVLADGELFSREILAGQRHSSLLLPLVGEVLAECGMELHELDGIAFGCGPGSFTGLRIGCGVAQGLALGADLPVIGVSTLLALAEGSGGARVIACLDARMGEVYHAAYEKGAEGWQVVAEPGLFAPQAVPELAGEGWVGSGSGFAAYGEALRQSYAGQLSGVIADAPPRASDMARLAAPLFERGAGMDAAQAAPLYIRNKVALKTSER